MSGSVDARAHDCPRVRVLGGLAITVALALVCLLAVAGAVAGEAGAAGKTEGWTRVVNRGLTDPNNTYAPSYARFKDHLYLSTIASPASEMYSGSGKVGGEIWRTADGTTWERVGKPGLGDVRNVSFTLVTFKDRLYAVSTNTETGLEIWVSSDGLKFEQLDTGALGGDHDSGGSPFVFNDRLIVGVTNSDDGAEIWVSDDGVAFRTVVTGGMGDRSNNAIQPAGEPVAPEAVFRDELYVGVVNAEKGGEIWRTADGLVWERAPAKGIARGAHVVIYPSITFQDKLYTVRIVAGTVDDITGLDVCRTSDGATWEKVVSDGFGAGGEQNALGFLAAFKGDLYLCASTYDPRLLWPTKPAERRPPQGFQVWRSSDGKTWSQVGEDGFGADTTFMVTALVDIGGDAYMAAFDYHRGDQLWRSANGKDWRLVFRQPVPSWYGEGGGPIEYVGHILMVDNDLKRGVQIWRTDEAVAGTGATTGTPTPAATPTPGATSSAGGGGSGEGGEEPGASATGYGLSTGWLAAIVVAVVALAGGVAAFIYARGRGRRPPGGSPVAAVAPAPVPEPDVVQPSGSAPPAVADAGAVPPAAGQAGATPGGGTASSPPVGAVVPEPRPAPASRSFCSACGSALDPGARFCANCGKGVPGSE